MARSNTIKVSDEEKEILDTVRQEMYGTDEVPYGTVVEALGEEYLE